MEIVFKVVDNNNKFVGFIKDPLLNLSITPDRVLRESVNSKSELLSCTQRYQMNLDMLFKMNDIRSNPLSKLRLKVYDKYFKNYKLGDLKVITSPTNKYL